MAQVPYDPTSSVAPEQRAPDDYVRAQANPNAFGAGIAQGAEALGKGAVSAGQHWEQIQTDDVTNQYQREASQITNDFVSNQRGQNALDGGAKFKQNLYDLYDTYKDKLTSPEQMHQFDSANRPFTDRNLMGQINTHLDRQGVEYATSVNNAGIQNSHTMAANAATSGLPNAEGTALVAYHNTLNWEMKQLQLNGGDKNPTLVEQAKDRAGLTLKTYAESLSVADPKTGAQRAMDFAQRYKTELGTAFEPVFNSLSERADRAVATGASADALAKAKTSPATMVAGGARNNNPGNIVDGAWAKSQPGYTGSNGRFAVFDSTASGAAAMGKNLASYATQGVTTLNQLTAKWAPVGDGANDPGAYARTIAAATGIDPNTPINLADPAVQAKIIPAMARVEQGHAVAGLTGSTGSAATPGVPRAALGSQPQPFGQPTIPEQVSATTPNASQPDLPIENASLTTPAADAGPTPQPEIAASPEDVFARQVQNIGENPNLSDRQRKMAVEDARQNFTMAQVAAEQDAKAKREAKEGAVNEVMKFVNDGDPQSALQHASQLRQTHRVDESTYATLTEVIQKRAGADNPVTMGKGYDDIFKRMLLPANDPNRITDPMDVIRAEQQGDVTERGSNRLQENLARMKKDYKSFGDQMRVSNLQKTLKEKLTYTNETNGLKDTTGTDIYENQALPALLDQIDDWVGGGKKLSDMPILKDPKEIKAFVDQYRTDRDKDKARQAEINEMLGRGVPAPPNGVANEKYWTQVVQQPPTLRKTDGSMLNGADANKWWGGKITQLAANPSPDMIKAWDEKFAPLGYPAATVLNGLGVKFDTPPGYNPPAPQMSEYERENAAAVQRRKTGEPSHGPETLGHSPGWVGSAVDALGHMSMVERARRAEQESSSAGPTGDVKGMLTPPNIDLAKRPVVHNGDGSISTVRSITITDGDKAVLIPTVVGDKVVSNKEAIDHYKKTKEHLGVFDSEEDADAYAQNLHEAQAKFYKK